MCSWACVPLVALLAIGGPGLAHRLRADDGRFAHLMNIGKAHLENRESTQAIEAFAAAVKLESNSAAALRNLARAQLLASHTEAALDVLKTARALESESAATSYLTGLAYAHMSRFEDAVPYFESAVRLDPRTAALRYQLGAAHQASANRAKAIEQFRETIRLDPLHASAHYRLMGLARQAGDDAEAQQHQVEYARLRKLFGEETRTVDALERCIYTRPEPPPAAPAATQPAASRPAGDVRFTDATSQVIDDGAAPIQAAAVIEVDDHGRYTLFIAHADGTLALLTRAAAGQLERRGVAPKLAAGLRYECCVAGNFHDDVPEGTRYDPKVHARNDVFLIGPDGARLLERSGADAFSDVTERAGLSDVAGRRACWVDYDHDGDLDLLLARSKGAELWQNNGDGRFQNVTSEVGIGDTGPAVDVAAVDLDADGAIDLLVARGDQPTLVFVNQRAGRFARMPEPPGPWPAARRILLNDLDNDGSPDAVLIADRAVTIIAGKTGARQHFDLPDLDPAAGALIDLENDGRLDLCLVGRQRDAPPRGAVRAWRNADDGAWSPLGDAFAFVGPAPPPFTEVTGADVDADGVTDLLLMNGSGLRWLRNGVGGAGGQLKIKLVGTKTNPAGIGTHVELRSGDFWVTRAVTSLPIEMGLGARKHLDSLQTVWTNGIVDNQIGLALTPPVVTIVEKNVAAGSCPMLWAYDGERRRFVTDLLGNAPLGLSLRRDVLLPADADEIVRVADAADIHPRDGAYRLEVASCFREVFYLDQARLIAVDHPADVEVHPTDKLMPPPFPPSELWAIAAPRLLVRAAGDDGIDRTAALRAIDGDFAPPGVALPPPLRGMCAPLALSLDFGPLDGARPTVLALTGWLQYGDASTNIAASQNQSLNVVPPTLEAETDHGWTRVDVVVGMPAGKTKTILCDLTGKLTAGTRRLRLTTTFEIRWDRVALFERRPASEIHRHELTPVAADLHWFGFPEINSRAAGHPTTPDDESACDTPPWRTALQGWCTRYGDVLELVTTRDDRLVILNSGDGVTLRFDAAALPPIPAGLTRTFFFYSVGWDKDADYNVVDGDTVEPLPVPQNPSLGDDQTDWRLQFNTRWVPRDRFGPPSR